MVGAVGGCRREHDLDAAIRSQSTISLARLLTDVEYSAASQWAAFYAQNLSLVEFLTKLESLQEFVRFAKLSAELDGDRAPNAIYNMDSRELESRWRRQIPDAPLAAAES